MSRLLYRIANSEWLFIVQSIFAMFLTFGILIAFGKIEKLNILGAIGASSMAASSFISVSHPGSAMADSRHMIGGYLIGVSVGIIFKLFVVFLGFQGIPHLHRHILSATCAVGLSTYLMIKTHTEHPPAAGMSLGLVLEDWSSWTVVTIFIAIGILSMIRRFLVHLGNLRKVPDDQA